MIKRLLQIILLVIVAVFVWRYLEGQWNQIRGETLVINWPLLIFSQLGMIIGLAGLPLGSLLILKYLGSPLSVSSVYRIFYLANITKYLPGSIWALPGRAFLYQRSGIPVAKSAAAVFWEVLLMVFAAAVGALLCIGLIAYYIPLALVLVVATVGLLVIFVFAFLVYQGSLQHIVMRLPFPARLKEVLSREDMWLTLPHMSIVFGVYVGSWLVMGVSFAAMSYSVSSGFELSRWVELIGVFTGSWLIGFLVIITPGGIGVRDVLIGLAVAVFLADPLPVVVAVVSRIAWTIAELIGLICAILLYNTSSQAMTFHKEL